jgi:hypothetical protein
MHILCGCKIKGHKNECVLERKAREEYFVLEERKQLDLVKNYIAQSTMILLRQVLLV